MPRIPSGSYIKELDLSNTMEVILLFEKLTEHGVKEAGLLIEPCTIETVLNSEVHTVAIAPPAIILEENTFIQDTETPLYKVLKDAWAEYTIIDLHDFQSFLRSIVRGESTSVKDVEIKIYGVCPDHNNFYSVEKLLLNNSWRPYTNILEYRVLESLYRESFKENKIILLVNVSNETATPVVWLEIDKSKSINTCKPVPRNEPIVIGTLIDAFLYASLMKISH
jgi:hypothetical protein